VEGVLNPELRKYAYAVCGDPEYRHGIILAKNELAKSYGVKTGEAIWQAKSKCPKLVLVKPHYKIYSEYSEQIFNIYCRYTDLVEPFGIDECWLDVSGTTHLFGSGEEIADELRNVVKAETGLTISVGVSYNKIFAKMGSDYKKPDATTVINQRNFKTLLYPLPVGEMFMVGRRTAERLRNAGFFTIGDIAGADERTLKRLLGENGRVLWQNVNGFDYSVVHPFNYREAYKSIGNGATFKRDLVSPKDVRTCVFFLCDKVAARLRKHNVECSAVQVGIKDTNMHSINRSVQLQSPTDLSFDLRRTALLLIQDNVDVGREPIRALTITGTKLLNGDDVCEQISFLDLDYHKKRAKEQRLENAKDRIRHKYGLGTLTRCSFIHNEFGF
jgi:DNA polymerase-4